MILDRFVNDALGPFLRVLIAEHLLVAARPFPEYDENFLRFLCILLLAFLLFRGFDLGLRFETQPFDCVVSHSFGDLRFTFNAWHPANGNRRRGLLQRHERCRAVTTDLWQLEWRL